MVNVSALDGRRFASRLGHTKDHHKNGTNCVPCIGMHALALEFDTAAYLSKRPGKVWNCLWGHALKRSLGINCKSRVLYPGSGFLSSATWPSLPKKHYNGLINQPINPFLIGIILFSRNCDIKTTKCEERHGHFSQTYR